MSTLDVGERIMQSQAIVKSSFFNLYQLLEKYSLSYAYSGVFTEALTRRILMLAEQNMNDVGEDGRMRKRVYFVIVEALQNITRHQSTNCTRKDSYGFFSLHRAHDSYIITSGNIICNEEINVLKEKLEKVNSLNQTELTGFYNDVLRAGEISDKGGAGLGLIDMVRKSGNRLSYEFIHLDDEWSYFYFQSKVSGAVETDHPGQYNLDDIKTIHNVVRENNLRTIYFGKISHENLNGLLSASEDSITNNGGGAETEKATAAVINEMMRNICDHASSSNLGDGKDAMLLIGDDGSYRSIVTGNLITESKKTIFLEKIKRINQIRLDELKNAYGEKKTDSKIPGGLGLLQMRMKSGNPIEAEFVPYDNKLHYISVKAKIDY